MIKDYILFSLMFFGIILSLFSSSKRDVFSCVLLILLAVLMVFIAGLRANDSDYYAYKEMYESVPMVYDFSLTSIRDIHGEVGYLYLSSLFKTIGISFQVFLFFIAFLSITLTVSAFNKISILPLLSLIFYLSHAFLVRDMIQIRAGLAVSIILFSIVNIKSYKKGILAICIAGLIHSGAFAVAIIYPFLRKKVISVKMFIFAFVVLMLFSYVNGLSVILSTLANYNLLPSSISTYIGWAEYDYRIPVVTNPVFIKGLLIIFLLHKYIGRELKSEAIITLYNLYVIGMLFMAAFSEMAILSGRLSSFLTAGESVLIIYALFYKRNLSLSYMLFLAIVILQMFYDLYISNVHPNVTILGMS
ncbi:EpsG family protein [Buttiauxella sp. 3AFRM03]|uniref:EpsG family protein n=1 Tax=Buttiauxella sp. 3AFRM03 TaxID=2479367 RepID=UPI000EF7BE81|nr:EpsG family protein [Buttiauxella sp. 3AFRM03]AYN29776.1 EpsG family protein [Buttiauxella sp. 3AFRM03]